MTIPNKRRRQLERVAAGIGLLIAMALSTITVDMLRQQNIVEYDNVWHTPDKAEVCPGDVITFPVRVSILEAPAIVRLVESWCREDGICPFAYTTVQYVALMEPYTVTATARRTVPPELPPGVWQLNHVTESHSNSHISVEGWAVRVTVKQCESQPHD